MNYAPNSKYQRAEIIKIIGNAYRSIRNMDYAVRNFYKQMAEFKAKMDAIVDEGDVYLSHFVDDEDWLNPLIGENEFGYVYYLTNADKDMVKIGVSKDPIQRAKAIQTSSGQDIEVIHTIYFDNFTLYDV